MPQTQSVPLASPAMAPAAGDRFERILGVEFFNGTVTEALDLFLQRRGFIVLPASPALSKLQVDADYRSALQAADVALLDSGLLAAAWRAISGRPVHRISGLSYLKSLLGRLDSAQLAHTLWLVSSAAERDRAVAWFGANGFAFSSEQFRIKGVSESDHALLLDLESLRPEHIIVATAGGTQEKLGCYLRDYLLYRPCVHCVGAALNFLTGAECPIPEWAETMRLGWLLRFASQPGMIVPRIAIAVSALRMLLRYRSELPPLRARWADV